MVFKIVSGDSPDMLSYWVNQHIKDGWRPNGNMLVDQVEERGIYGTVYHTETKYRQPMVKD